ncbi:MAG: hypothetical protein ACFBRM_10700 [Pikeienuella sp.]
MSSHIADLPDCDLSDYAVPHPADELHAIRTEIRALKAREAALRVRLIGGHDRAGRRFCAEIVTGIRRRIDAASLPLSVRADPRSYLGRETVRVRLVPL